MKPATPSLTYARFGAAQAKGVSHATLHGTLRFWTTSTWYLHLVDYIIFKVYIELTSFYMDASQNAVKHAQVFCMKTGGCGPGLKVWFKKLFMEGLRQWNILHLTRYCAETRWHRYRNSHNTQHQTIIHTRAIPQRNWTDFQNENKQNHTTIMLAIL